MLTAFLLSAALSSSPVVTSNNINFHTYIINEYATASGEIKLGYNMDNEKLKNNLEKLNKFLSFEDNWNDNGASAFSEKLINRIKNLLMNLDEQPDVFPTANNSIQIEYEKETGEYLEFEIFETGRVHMYNVNADGEEIEKEFDFDLQEIKYNIGAFYGRIQ